MTWKLYSVRFAARDCFMIDVKARSENEAMAKVQDLYDRYGAVPEKGFVFDLSEGGTSDWHAEEVAP